MALFTYLSVYNNEWKEGNIRAHGMFWCVKGPIMVIFYFGDILLAALKYFNVIKDQEPTTPGGLFWTAAAIKNGYYVLIICLCMAVVAKLMQYYFGLDAIEEQTEVPDYNYFEAFADAFLAYIPQFVKNVFNCGGDTVVLAKKRIKLRKERRLSDDMHSLLSPERDLERSNSNSSIHEYLAHPPPSLQNNHNHNNQMQSIMPLEHIYNKDDEKKASSYQNSPTTRTGEVDELGVVQQPQPPMQSRSFGRNEQVSLQSMNQHSSHFTPHDKQ